MPRTRRSVVFLCIAVIALTAFLPGGASADYAIPEPQWILLPDLAVVLISFTTPAPDELSSPLSPVLPSRAPPQQFLP